MRRLSEVRFRRYADLDAQSIWAMIGRDLLLDVCEYFEPGVMELGKPPQKSSPSNEIPSVGEVIECFCA